MGADQGGSIRMPASWCGVVGLKPTHGLVPYTGVVALDPTIDYAGPIARTVEDCALALDAVAGRDGLDPRQGRVGPVETDDYPAALDGDPGDLTVGVLAEGFDREETDPAVDEAVEDALAAFEAAGADVREVSVPMHEDGPAVLTAVYMEGAAALVRDEGVGHFSRGYYDDGFAVAFGRARRENPGDFPPMFKLALLVGRYMAEEYHGRYYARGQNLLRDLAAAYDEALADVDVLALPTTPHAAHRVDEDASLAELMERSLTMNNNTSPFNGSGHPAITVPCGTVAHDLPAGLMFVGERFDEASVLRAAAAFERSVTDAASP
jgi:amidase